MSKNRQMSDEQINNLNTILYEDNDGAISYKIIMQGPEAIAQAILVHPLTSEVFNEDDKTLLENYCAAHLDNIIETRSNLIRENIQTNRGMYSGSELRYLAQKRLGDNDTFDMLEVRVLPTLIDNMKDQINRSKPIYIALNYNNKHWVTMAIVPVKKSNILRVIGQDSLGSSLQDQKFFVDTIPYTIGQVITEALENPNNRIEFIDLRALVQDDQNQCVNSCGAFTIRALEIIKNNQAIISSPRQQPEQLQELLRQQIIEHDRDHNTPTNSYRMQDAAQLLGNGKSNPVNNTPPAEPLLQDPDRDNTLLTIANDIPMYILRINNQEQLINEVRRHRFFDSSIQDQEIIDCYKKNINIILDNRRGMIEGIKKEGTDYPASLAIDIAAMYLGDELENVNLKSIDLVNIHQEIDNLDPKKRAYFIVEEGQSNGHAAALAIIPTKDPSSGDITKLRVIYQNSLGGDLNNKYANNTNGNREKVKQIISESLQAKTGLNARDIEIVELKVDVQNQNHTRGACVGFAADAIGRIGSIPYATPQKLKSAIGEWPLVRQNHINTLESLLSNIPRINGAPKPPPREGQEWVQNPDGTWGAAVNTRANGAGGKRRDSSYPESKYQGDTRGNTSNQGAGGGGISNPSNESKYQDDTRGNTSNQGAGGGGISNPSNTSFAKNEKSRRNTSEKGVWPAIREEINNNPIISENYKYEVYAKLRKYIDQDLSNSTGSSKAGQFIAEVGRLHPTTTQKSSPTVERAMEELYTRVLEGFKNLEKTNSKSR
ncbi:MAG: Ulp1 family isopeptidase [Rickettsiaceae bacterium]|nr:Ulp1 family isopeptidase [Rickettsiaceae bacterium]